MKIEFKIDTESEVFSVKLTFEPFNGYNKNTLTIDNLPYNGSKTKFYKVIEESFNNSIRNCDDRPTRRQLRDYRDYFINSDKIFF